MPEGQPRLLRIPPDAIVKHLQEKVTPLLGVLLTGSSAYRRDNDFGLDLYALTSGRAIRRTSYRWRETEIDVDLWTVTPNYVVSRLRSSTPVVRHFATGKVLLDTNSILANLMYEARIRYGAGPKPQTNSQIAQLRHRVAQLLEDCSHFLETRTQEDAQCFIALSLRSLLNIHCALQRMWRDDERALFEDLRLRSPNVFALTQSLISATSASARSQLLRNLADEILAEVGGPIKYFDCVFYEQATGIHTKLPTA